MRTWIAILLASLPTTALALGVCLEVPPWVEVVTVDCDQITPTEYPSDVVGFSADGEPCTNCIAGHCCSPLFQSSLYGWSVSASPTGPYRNTGTLGAGADTLFVFLTCNLQDGAAAAGFHITTDDPALVVTGFAPADGVLNAGTATEPLLALGGCREGPTLIGAIGIDWSPTPVEPSTWGSVKALYR
jgi:hypothetical protein